VGFAMNKLIEDCKNHNYVYLKKESMPIHEPLVKVVEKTIFACIDCGSGLDVYDLENAVVVK
jgi:hypothetical protein